MELFTNEQRAQLLANGAENIRLAEAGKDTIDFRPVVKLHFPLTGAKWLLTELDPEDPDIAFGLCDLNMGFPEIGTVSILEILAVTGPRGETVKRDELFEAERPLSAYADEARHHHRIVA